MGDNDEKPGTSVVVHRSGVAREILEKALGGGNPAAEPGSAVDDPARSLPTEMRRLRRGKFFLSNFEQEQFGSISRPIFEYYCHKAIVGETRPDPAHGGIWCFAYHPDFELIPEFQPPSSWPEYVRTPTGWKKAETARWADELLHQLSEQQRLGYEGEKS